MHKDDPKKNKLLLFAITVLIYMATVLPHEIVGSFIGSFFEVSGRSVYDAVTLSVLLLAIIAYGLIVYRKLKQYPDRIKKGVLYLVVTTAAALLAMKTLVVINVEMVHFFQYGLLSYLVFRLTRRYGYTIWIILFLAFVDESYQHFFLTPNRFAYLDFNDMFLDLIGAGFGLTSLYCLGFKSAPPNKTFRWRLIYFLISIPALALILYLTGTLQIWPGEDGSTAWIQIYEQRIEGFWTTVRKVERFHIMRPFEALIVLGSTIYFYSRLDD